MADSCDAMLLDLMLGKLAVYLRMCGIDAAYAGDLGIIDDEVLFRLARTEGRVLVSQDEELVSRTETALLVESRSIADQLTELQQAGIELEPSDPPVRCGRCNGVLEGEIPEISRPAYAPSEPEIDCYRCRACGQCFWRGSHFENLSRTLSEITESSPPE